MRRLLQILLPVVFVLVLIVPGYTYFVTDQAGAVVFGNGIDPSVRLFTLFRLFGLYAFTLVWGQLIVGPFMAPLSQLYGKRLFDFHRAEGLFVLLLATVHPLIFYTAFYMQSHSPNFLNAIPFYTSSIYAYLGPVAWTLLVVTVVTASLRNRPWLVRRWHWIHLFNYVVFISVFFHSLIVGTDTRQWPMVLLYPVFGVTFLVSVSYRRVYRRIKGQDNL